ncbi:hypothetical protein ABPG72_010229 [Tetrahymena utriculariae]
MKLNKNNIQKIFRKDEDDTINFSNSQLVSINNLGQFIDSSQITSLNLDRNHLKEIEEIFSQMVNLKYLSMEMNHIRFLAYFDNMQSLQQLNLSMNRIVKVDQLNSCKNLRLINLSMNYIEEVEDLQLPYLEQLYLQGNKLTRLPSFQYLPRLRYLDISKNELSDINPILSQKALNYLEKLICSYNRIPSQYLEDFCFILSSLPNLLELDASGNEITINSLYRSSVLTAKKLKLLDGLEINDSTIEQIQSLKQTENFERAIQDTNKNYIERMQKENEAKLRTKKLLLDQIDRIDDMFENFQKKTEMEQKQFLEYITIMEKRYRSGDKIQLDQDTVKLWSQRIQSHEAELKQKIDYQKQIQQHQRDVFLQKEVNGLTLREKLYDIALNDPDLWRDLKSKELQQVYKEEKRNEQREYEELQKRIRDQSSVNYGQLEDDIRKNIAQKIQSKLQMIEDYSKDDINQQDKERQQLNNLSQNQSMNFDQKSFLSGNNKSSFLGSNRNISFQKK